MVPVVSILCFNALSSPQEPLQCNVGFCIASPQQGDLGLPCPPSGWGADAGAQTFNKRSQGSQVTVPLSDAPMM
ncbi:hypothetical protein PoB_005905500 [Plakobranchus ocellatus]|uniref:Uncharacterized protein n=1 Tax=Plakobranchus ocellatus TaxID=259542 RepID=A0AAV4CLF4_9GAST|nr:hypothetical protein PoB_005905500 [Plakobranchus ocellatus]